VEVKDALESIRKALAEVEGKGQTLLSTEALRQYLDGLEKNAGVSSEVRKLQHESSLAQYKAGRDQSLAMFNSVIGFAQVALKTSLLVNGAASIALLTFIGNIWTKTQTAAVAKALSSSLALFAVGALAAALATVTTYITQWGGGNRGQTELARLFRTHLKVDNIFGGVEWESPSARSIQNVSASGSTRSSNSKRCVC
jgi:hypothetical protein